MRPQPRPPAPASRGAQVNRSRILARVAQRLHRGSAMRKRHRAHLAAATFVCVATVSLLAVSPTIAAADPLRVESGFLFVSNNEVQAFGLDFGLFGDGFDFRGEYGHSRDYLIGFAPEYFRLLFSPAEALDSCAECSAYGGDFVFRALDPPPLSSWRPFTFEGQLDEYLPGSTTPDFRHALIGSGRLSTDGQTFALYQFQTAAPVPEPSTMVLVGAGLAAAYRTAKRRRRRSMDSAIS